MDDGEFIVYVIYDHPTDFPEHFVVRRWVIDDSGHRPMEIASLCDSITEARDEIPAGLIRFPREPQEHPSIVESWI